MPFTRGDIVKLSGIWPERLSPEACGKVVRAFPPSQDREPMGMPTGWIYMVMFDDGYIRHLPEVCIDAEAVGREDPEPTRYIDLDAKNCKSNLDFLKLLRDAVGSPEWQGDSVDAFIDTMLFGGAELQTPYTLRVQGTSSLPAGLASEITEFVNAIDQYIERQCGPGRDERLEVVS
jgi:hypothetical protein